MSRRAVSPELRRLASGVAIALLFLLAAYRQPLYPAPWLDEGFALQGAMNLVRYGQYAMRSAEEFRILDQPLVANGPGIVLPITAVFAAFGIGFLQARLLAAVLLTLTGVAFYAVARRLYGSPAAWISVFLLLAVPLEGFLWFGRMALGTVPAFGYFLAGYLLWLALLERDRWGYAVGAGLMFGLALVTKGQYGLLLPMLFIVSLAGRFYYRAIDLKKGAVALGVAVGCLGLWYGVQLLLVGWENFGPHLDAIRASSRVTVMAFRPNRLPGNVWYVIRSGLPLFVLPGWVYAAWACRKRDAAGFRPLLGVVFVPVWLGWYVVASTGWPRYAFDAYALGLLFAGHFVVDALRFLQRARKRGASAATTPAYLQLGTLLLVAGILVGGLWGFGRQVAGLLDQPDRSLDVFAQYLQDHVSPQVVVESWEWQVDVLADLNYHHPPNAVVDTLTAINRYHDDLEIAYDPLAYEPEYLIDGPWSKAWDMYAPALAEGCCTLEFRQPPYDLYRVDSSRAGQ